MSEVITPDLFEAVIEWHDEDDEKCIELSSPMSRAACVKWLAERAIIADETGLLIVDDQPRITDSLDNDRYCYYHLRPSSQMRLI